MTRTTSHPTGLHIVRIPGECGPILRCSGELTVATAEALKRQVDLLAGLDHPAMILNLASCNLIDADGVMLLLDAYRSLRARGQQLALVTGSNPNVRFLRLLDLDWFLPTFPNEESAQRALRGGGPTDAAPATWEDARADSLVKWRLVLSMLDRGTPQEAMREITSMHGLCRHSEELHQHRCTETGVRCEVCPLFKALGAHESDIGCRSATQPMVEALIAGDRESAKTRVAGLVQIIEQMPLP
jgi:anti-anti-sigma factor